MEKWRSKGKTSTKSDSLLPPTLRQQQQQQDIDYSSTEKRKGKRWTIGGFLKRISHRDGDASSSGEASTINTPIVRRRKAKNILKNKSSRRAIRSSLQTKKDLDFQYSTGKSSLDINPFIFPIVESLPQEFLYSRSSEGSLDGSNKKIRKDKIKARVEAKRDKLCTNSSTDDSSNESRAQNGYKNDVCLRKKRNARAERFMKSLCREDQSKVETKINERPNYRVQIQETENPLVKQTLQYFSDFDKSINKSQERERRRVDSRRRQTQQIFPVTSNSCDVSGKKSRSQEDIHHFEMRVSPRIPNSCYASSLDSYYKSPRIQKRPICIEKSNPINWENEYDDTGIYSRIRSPSQWSDRSDFRTPSLSDGRKTTPGKYSPVDKRFNFQGNHSNFSNRKNANLPMNGILPMNENSTINENERKLRDSERRSSKNLEEALCELEEIYNSLQLGDEDLLERAEKRSMEEYTNKKMENILIDLETNCKNSRKETEPNILRDDMAFRRLRSVNRPTSDGHAMLSNISYLITSPIASRRDTIYMDPRQKIRGKEPDITLDDVVFRNLHHANNTLKVVEPQPPFGIPLGPITGATESDYLHTKPTRSESRSPHLPREPDVVTDDLAFRNLRKDKNNQNDCWEKSSNFVSKKKRAVRSLSANLYSLINRRNGPEEVEWDFENIPGVENVNLDINGNQSEEIEIKRTRGDDRSPGIQFNNFENQFSRGIENQVPGKRDNKVFKQCENQFPVECENPYAGIEFYGKRENSFAGNTEFSGKSQKFSGSDENKFPGINESQSPNEIEDNETKKTGNQFSGIENRGNKIENMVKKIENQSYGKIDDKSSNKIEGQSKNRIKDQFKYIIDDQPENKIEDQPKNKIKHQLEYKNQDQPRNQIEDHPKNEIKNQEFRSEDKNQIENYSKNKIGDQLKYGNEHQSKNRIENQSESGIEDQSTSKIEDQPKSRIKNNSKHEIEDEPENKIKNKFGYEIKDRREYGIGGEKGRAENQKNRIENQKYRFENKPENKIKNPTECQLQYQPEYKIEDQENRTEDQKDRIKNQKDRFQNQKDRIEDQKDRIKDLKHQIEDQKNRIEHQKDRLEDKKIRIDQKNRIEDPPKSRIVDQPPSRTENLPENKSDQPPDGIEPEDQLSGNMEKSSKDLGPFTEQEISIYRQLCQELENLVDSTKSNEPSIEISSDVPSTIRNTNELKNFAENNLKLTTDEIDEIGNEITCLREKLTNFACTKEIDDNIKDRCESERREKSKINDNIDESCKLKKCFNEKPHCSRNNSNSMDASVSEGENMSCKEASNNVCNAELLLLTIKYVCYVTNHIKAHFFLLLAFFFVLLLAITTMP